MSTKKHDLPEALRTSLLAGYQKPEDLIGENGLLKQLHMPVFRPHRDNGRAVTSALAGRCRIVPLISQRIEGRVDAHTHLAAIFIGQGVVTVDATGYAAQHLVGGATVRLGGGICLDAAASWMRLHPGGALGGQLAAYLPARKLLTFGQLFGCELRYDLISVIDSYCLALRR